MSKWFDRDRSERLREMREHVGVNPNEAVTNGNRRDRRLAAKVIREHERRTLSTLGDHTREEQDR